MRYAVAGAPWLLSLSAGLTSVGLLRAGRARATAGLLALTALTLAIGALTPGLVLGDGLRPYWVVAALFLGPAAAILYPAGRWRSVADSVALGTVASAGALALLVPSTVITMTVVVLLALVVHTWWRLEHSQGSLHRSVSWLALSGGSATLVAGVLSFAIPEPLGLVLGSSVFVVVGPALYLGAVRPETVDVRAAVIVMVSYLTAAVCYVAAFIGLASLVEVLGGRGPSVPVLGTIATVLALALHPTQVLLRGMVATLIFGSRPDPLAAAGQVSQRVSDDPAVAVRAIREVLALPYVALLVDGAPVAESGQRTTATESRTLPGASLRPMVLEVGLRSGDFALSADERRVLTIAAPLVAQSLRASALAVDLQESQRQAVAAREEERRRLRRDLHDGLGPRLTGITYTADAARNVVSTDPAAAAELLDSLRAEARVAIESIRDLVEALRPPALDELGLAEALHQAGSSVRRRTGAPLEVCLTLGDLTGLAAAVEVAVYRITVEALTNVARHSDGACARVVVRRTTRLIEVVVTDSGSGTGPRWAPGVGLASMGERARELGGSLEAGPTPEGGRVRAVLPLAPDRPATASRDRGVSPGIAHTFD